MIIMRKHVVFVIDASKSMDKCDVIDQGTHKCDVIDQGTHKCDVIDQGTDKKKRIDAVLDACFDFIKDQLQDGRSSAEDRYSVVSFNNVASVHLHGKRMAGRNLYTLRKDLEAKTKPKLGTSYGAGLASAWGVASGGMIDPEEQFVLIFLSDGRPGDMHPSSKKQQAAVSKLHEIRECFRERLTFHGVGVGPEDFQLLEELCTVAQGTFHRASLASAMKGGGNAVGAPSERTCSETLSDTFREISSSVSSLCSSSSSRTKKSFVLEDSNNGDWNMNVDKYVCDKLALEGGRLVVQMRDLDVLVREKPFAEGGMRHCFRMWGLGPCRQWPEEDPVPLVGKQTKFYLSISDQLRGFTHDLDCHALAQRHAELFNHQLGSFIISQAASDPTYAPLRNSGKGLKITSCDVYRLKDDQEPGRYRYLLVEPFLEGKYIKYNGNNGYVGKQDGLDQKQLCWWHVAQAFSHFTHHRSGGSFLVCDVQGVDERVTDLAVQSKLRKYGDGDRGSRGIRDFLDTHQCNTICQHLNLPRPGIGNPAVVPQTHAVATTSSAVHSRPLGFTGFAMPACEVIYEEQEIPNF